MKPREPEFDSLVTVLKVQALKILRWPALHFALLGGGLYVLTSIFGAAGPDEAKREPIHFDAADLEQIRHEFEQTFGKTPSKAELRAFVDKRVEDEILLREASRLGLAFGDRSIRQRLISKMRAVSSDLSVDEETLYQMALDLGFDRDVVIERQLRQKMRLFLQRREGPAVITEDELRQAMERHREKFSKPPVVDFSHVFLGHGAGASERAEALLSRLHSESVDPESAASLGDSFPLPPRLAGQSAAELTARFGGAMAEHVMTAELGAWGGPVRSTFGYHLIFLHGRKGATLKSLESLRPQLLSLLEIERAESRVAAGLSRLRALYEVDIAWPESSESGRGAEP